MGNFRRGSGGPGVVFSVISPAMETETAGYPTRILFVIPGDGGGHSMIFARRQAASLRKSGVEVREFFLRSRTSALAMAREMRRFRSDMREFSPDIVHAQFGTATALFAALGAMRTPLVITFRGSDLNPSSDGRLRAAAGHFLSQIAALRARRIVCVSRGLRGRLWWRRSRAAVLPSGVDPEMFRPQPRNLARERLGWSASDRVVLFNAGTSARVKRIDLACAAIEAARLEIPDLRWEVLDGSTCPGKMVDVMNAADCLLLTSDYEGSPTVVQEALATNLPIVSVDAGDVGERTAGVRHTRVVGRETAALARAIVDTVREPVRTDGRNHVEEVSFAKISERLLQIYQQAMGSESPWNISSC
jgi:glycosyltransferase involved in cell wall biosynthesis